MAKIVFNDVAPSHRESIRFSGVTIENGIGVGRKYDPNKTLHVSLPYDRIFAPLGYDVRQIPAEYYEGVIIRDRSGTRVGAFVDVVAKEDGFWGRIRLDDEPQQTTKRGAPVYKLSLQDVDPAPAVETAIHPCTCSTMDLMIAGCRCGGR